MICVEKLHRRHAVDEFDCGEPSLNRFLQRHALNSQASGGSTTYVATEGEIVLGYHSLAVGEVAYADASERLAKGLARHPVPVMLLARLAVARGSQGSGLGRRLLGDAVRRTLAAAGIAGVRALVVHAKDDAARLFYQHYDFEPAPSDPRHLWILIKDLRAAFDG